MRVTEQMIYGRTNASLAANQSALQSTIEKVSTTKQLNRPSDNPGDVRSAVGLRDTLAQLDQFGRNIDDASSKVSAMDTALASAGDLVGPVRGQTRGRLLGGQACGDLVVGGPAGVHCSLPDGDASAGAPRGGARR